MAMETPHSLDDLKPMVPQIVAQTAMLLGRINAVLAQNVTLLARIAELEGKSGKPPKTPDDSSLPPSSVSIGAQGQLTQLSAAVWPQGPHRRCPHTH
jgi:hypothetical protein